MRKLTFALAAVAVLVLLGADSNTANAAYGYSGFGIHIGGRNVHLNIGRSHGYGLHQYYRTEFRASHHYNGHNTSYFDYHPGSYQWNYNHYDYVPGHLDYHQTGHRDRHRSYRRW